MRRSLKLIVPAVVGALAVAGALALAGDGDDDAAPPAPATTDSVDTTVATVVASSSPPFSEPSAPTPAGLVDVPPAFSLIAMLTSDVPRYAAPGGEPDGVIASTWLGRPSALAVIEQEPEWLHVRLAQRPNGSTAWIRTTDVELTTTPYRIEVDVATKRLRLFNAGTVVMDAPAGIGIDAAPTVLGNFFVTFLQEPPDDRNWGPFVMVTSAHSETISDWEQSGDAIAAIHGPLDTDDEIGTSGAKVSHGCIRLHVDDLARLRDVPAGSPVDVIDSAAPAATAP